MPDKITIARVERYLSLTAKARQKATPTTSTEKEEKMLKDLEMKVPDEDPKQEMADLEDHLVGVKERVTAKEKLTIRDQSNVPREGEEKSKIGNMKKNNKGHGLRRGFPKMTEVT